MDKYSSKKPYIILCGLDKYTLFKAFRHFDSIIFSWKTTTLIASDRNFVIINSIALYSILRRKIVINHAKFKQIGRRV